jgi:hypothetical protein
MRYLITNGFRDLGYNPKHTAGGKKQIQSLVTAVPDNISRIVMGTGVSFVEICEILIATGRIRSDIPKIFSPFCGTADGLRKDGMIITCGDIPVKNETYHGPAKSPAFDSWKFISCFPRNTLFCANCELLIALNSKATSKEGCLYQIDNIMNVTLIRDGAY